LIKKKKKHPSSYQNYQKSFKILFFVIKKYFKMIIPISLLNTWILFFQSFSENKIRGVLFFFFNIQHWRFLSCFVEHKQNGVAMLLRAMGLGMSLTVH
jgi:hypothetical protein